MAVRTAVLGRATVGPGFNYMLASVPANEVWIVKSVAAWNSSAFADAGVTCWGWDATLTLRAMLVNQSLAAGAMVELAHWVVLQGGDQVAVRSTSQSIGWWVSGTKLKL